MDLQQHRGKISKIRKRLAWKYLYSWTDMDFPDKAENKQRHSW